MFCPRSPTIKPSSTILNSTVVSRAECYRSYISETLYVISLFFCLVLLALTFVVWLSRNHASNVYMLHVVGITHVLFVGECALFPPPPHSPTSAEHSHTYNMSPACQFILSTEPGDHGSLWIEEREGRIKVLDTKSICDDGIDTLEPQTEPICDWIDRARQRVARCLFIVEWVYRGARLSR